VLEDLPGFMIGRFLPLQGLSVIGR